MLSFSYLLKQQAMHFNLIDTVLKLVVAVGNLETMLTEIADMLLYLTVADDDVAWRWFLRLIVLVVAIYDMLNMNSWAQVYDLKQYKSLSYSPESPDFMPIEMVWNDLKFFLTKNCSLKSKRSFITFSY